MDKPNRKYTVFFKGYANVEAENEDRAVDEIGDKLNEAGGLCFEITSSEDDGCADCGDTGYVLKDEVDGDGNIERGVGSQKCACKAEDNEE